MRLLFIGDVVGKPGREGLAAAHARAARPSTSRTWSSSTARTRPGGVGITEETATELFEVGADVITLGNHAYRHRDVYPYLDSEQRIVRPANFPASNPGRGHTIVGGGGHAGRRRQPERALHLQVERNPFPAIDELLDSLAGARTPIVVDFHAELTSEKVAMGWHLDGRVGGGARHPHPRADRRRAGAARRDRPHHRRRHDRVPRRRDRRQARAGAEGPS